jgi:hypothetical protein
MLCRQQLPPLPASVRAPKFMFARIVRFMPTSEYWRQLHHAVSTHLFVMCDVATHELGQHVDATMRDDVGKQTHEGGIVLQRHL